MADRPVRRSRHGSARGLTLLLAAGLRDVMRMPFDRARHASTVHTYPFRDAYVADLGSVLDLEAVGRSGLRIGVDPLGGAGVHYWAVIAERYG